MHVGQWQAVAGAVLAADALLAAGRGDAHDSGVGAQRRVGHEGEVRGAGWLPLKGELLTAARLEVLDAQRVRTGGQVDGAVLGIGAVQAVVVDDLPVTDVQA
ncbi:hypothetical protein SGRIM128S_03555 [Streptomyces griseomycini]